MKKPIALFVLGIENLKKPKVSYIFKKYQFFLLFAASVKMKMKKYLKKNQFRY